jgi:carboxypeptidase A2
VSFRVFRYVAAAAAVFMGTFASAREGDTPVRYDDHALVRVQIASASDLAFMRSITVHLMSEGEGIGAVEYIVSPKGLEALRSSRIKHDVLIEDLQPIVDEQRRRRAERRAGGGIAGVSWFDDYKTYDEYNAKLAELEALRPDLASVFLVGLSIEGREIRGIRITGPGADKPAVLINGCQHAREWIAPKATIYAADRLIGEYDVDPVVKDLVDDVEFLLVPIVNPDGYVYSWGSDRWWRTNRRDNGDGTFGVDLNRNWAYEWGHDNGSSPVPGHELYRGPAPFSEPETQAMRDLFQANPQIVGNIDFHSYGQLILYPWSYGYDIAPDALLLHLLGETMAASIQGVHGRHYNNQQGVILYPASGAIIDWVYGDQGVFSYTVELRTGYPTVFELPPEEIIPNCEEVFPAVLDMAAFATQTVRFDFPSGLPLVVEAGVQTAVLLEITSVSAPLEPGTARLFARVGPSGPFSDTLLTDLGGGTFEALLPAAPCGEVVQYYFEVWTTDTVVHRAPDGAPDALHASTAHEITQAFTDDFETDQGWTVTNDGITDGAWERGVPVGDGSAGDPTTDADGSGQCYLTDNAPGNSDVDGGTTTLTSPVMDATGPGAVIAYYRWYSNNNDGEPGSDVFVVEVSDSGGADWVVLETVGPSGPEVSGGWHRREFLVSEIAGITNSDQFRIRFHASDLGGVSFVEAGVDGVELETISCEPGPCPWDLDGSGDVGVTDFLEMLAVWGAVGVPADFDGGGVGVTDFLILLGNWGSCP